MRVPALLRRAAPLVLALCGFVAALAPAPPPAQRPASSPAPVSGSVAATARTGAGGAVVTGLAALDRSGQALDGVATRTSARFDIDPRAGSIRGALRLELTNRTPDQVDALGVRRFLVDEVSVPIVAEATEVVARSAAGRLPVRDRPQKASVVRSIVVDLVPDLAFGATTTVEVDFVVRAGTPRGEGASRVNPAFATFPAFALGDPGATDLTVTVAPGFEVEVVGDEMTRTDRPDGAVELRAERIADPGGFLATVVARDDDALLARDLSVGRTKVTVRAWPGDDEWADFTAELTRRGTPVLADAIGQRWPGGDELSIVETASPYAYGAAGWYLPLESTIEVGDALDPVVLLHELGHLWFNDTRLAGRWIDEGFAEHYANQAAEALGLPTARRDAPALDDPGRIALDDWSTPAPLVPFTGDREVYGYAASAMVIDRIADEIGPDAMRRVLDAATERRLAYPGREAFIGDGPPGWRELLDLFSDVGGSRLAATLFDERVVAEADRPQLAERATARDELFALALAGRGWIPPAGARRAMAEWRFTDARTAIGASTGLLEAARRVDATLRAGGLEPTTALQADYEATSDPVALAGAFTVAGDAARALVAAEAAARSHDGPLAAVGAFVLGADRDRHAARDALDDGRYLAAQRRAESAVEDYERAGRVGGTLVGVAGVVAAAVVLVVVIRRRRRPHAGPGPDPGPDLTPSGGWTG